MIEDGRISAKETAFQVIVMNKRKFIDEYKNFRFSEIDLMLEYVANKCRRGHSIIEINRWNDKGERV